MCAQEQRHAAVQAKHEAAAELARHQELREADASKMAALIESQAAKEKQHGRRAAKLKQKEEEMQVLENEVRPPHYPKPSTNMPSEASHLAPPPGADTGRRPGPSGAEAARFQSRSD